MQSMTQDEAELRRLANQNIDEGIEAFEHANNGLLAVSFAVSVMPVSLQ